MSKKMGEESRLWVSISISDFKEDPDQITKLLGQKPVRILKKGSPVPNTKIIQKFNLWTMHADSKSFDLEKQIDCLIKQLRSFPKLKSRIKKFKARVTAVLEIVGDDTRPSLGLTSKQSEKLGRMGLPFSVDYYFFGKPQK